MKEYVGHEAVFLIPNDKLGELCGGGVTIEEKIKRFLTQRHGAFRKEAGDIEGFWKGAYDGVYSKFVVAFVGEDKIPELEEFLEALALKIGNEAIYFRAGVKSWLLRPEPGKKYKPL